MTRRCPGLADLVQVAHEREDVVSLTRLIHQRLAASQRGAGLVEKTENGPCRIVEMDLAVGLLLGPAHTGHEEQLRIRLDGLCVGLWRSVAHHAGLPEFLADGDAERR